MKRVLSLFLLFPSLFIMSSLSSCSSQVDNVFGEVLVENITNAFVIDSLEHTQYWNDNDYWDFSSVKVHIEYNEDSSVDIPINSTYFDYYVSPSSPTGLPITNEGETISITVFDITFTDDKNNTLNIESHVFSNITIVEYPYKNLTFASGKIIVTLIIIIGFIIFFPLLLIFLDRKRRKENVGK